MTACVVVSVLAVPQRSAAAPSLALPAADYPRSTQVIVLPATDAEADRYFGPVHRSTFETLGRTDGVGWIQAGIWHFSTGAGSAVRTHQTVFAYGIHVFASKADAHQALLDVKLRTHGTHVARLYAKQYISSDARQTLSFLFFTFHEILVEVYYEYGGVAPASIAASLHHMFSKQSSHLAARARALDRAIHTPPTPPARPTSGVTPSPTATSTTSPTATATVIPSATASPTATATPLPTATPTITPTSTPVTLQVAGTPSSPVVAPGSKETIRIHVSLGAQGVAGAVINTTFHLPSGPVECDTATDTNGDASCFIIIPSDTPVGTQVDVTLFARAPDGEVTSGSTRFTVR